LARYFTQFGQIDGEGGLGGQQQGEQQSQHQHGRRDGTGAGKDIWFTMRELAIRFRR
jgi:hypothetical protein